MYIEDDELRELYKSTSTERLQTLEASLLHLEKHPGDRAQLESFLREAHTLKGDSRMLDLKDVETLTHQIENLMVGIKEGENKITSELCDRLYRGIDSIRRLVREAVTGEPSGINTFFVLADLMGAGDSAISEPTQTDSGTSENLSEDDLFGDFNNFLNEQIAIPELPQPEAVENEPIIMAENLETIRVEATKLDILMRQAGELSITNLRIARRSRDLEEIIQLYEDWNRDTAVNRSALKQLDNQTQQLWQRAENRLERLGNLVNSLKAAVGEDSTSLENISNNLESGIANLRLLPFSTLFNLFPRMVRDLAKQVGKQVKLEIEGAETRVDKRILEEMKDPLLHIIRNAIDHGLETPEERQSKGKSSQGTIRLKGSQKGDRVMIEVAEDGRGLNVEAIKRKAIALGTTKAELDKLSTAEINSLIFTPGFSTRNEVTEISGRGIGLDVVRANVERLKGTIEVESVQDQGCKFLIQLNTNLATSHVLIAQVNQTSYAIPVESVETMLLLSRQEIFSIEGSQTITFAGQPVSVVWLSDLLELPITSPSSAQTANSTTRNLSCLILKIGTERLGILVDALTDRQDIVLKPQSKLIKRVRNIAGATILSDGQVCMVVNPQDLLKSVQKSSGTVNNRLVETVKTKNKILLVEDSIIIRTQMKRLLEGAGYEVAIAVDGLEGFNKLKAGTFDAVVSDVEMPNLSGLQLTAKIRQYQEYQEMPIILVTTLASSEDKRRGAEAGANAYLTKGDFDQKILIDTLRRLIS